MEKKKKVAWSRQETTTFLQLCLDEKVPQLLDGKKFRTNETFLSIKTIMDTLNFERTTHQLIEKYRRLKSQFIEAKNHNNRSGQNRMQFEYYDEMDRLLGGRPVSAYPSLYGIDSSEIVPDSYSSIALLSLVSFFIDCFNNVEEK